MPDVDTLSELERRLAALRVENQRLRNLLRITNGVEPPPEQPTLTPADPGLVTNSSPQEAKLALYMRLFAARRDVYASYWENARKRTKGWSPVTCDRFGKGSLWDRRPLPLTADVIARHLSNTDLFVGLYPLLPDATCWWLAADFDGPQAMLDLTVGTRGACVDVFHRPSVCRRRARDGHGLHPSGDGPARIHAAGQL